MNNGASTSFFRSSISSFFRCIFLPPNSSTSGSITAGVDTTPLRASGLDSCTAAPHTVYAYLTGLLVTLTGIKYEGSGNNPFNEHPAVMMLFLISILVHAIAVVTFPSDQINYHSPNLKLMVCHISGTLACELLVLNLVPPIWCFVINVSSVMVIVALCLSYYYLFHLFNHNMEGQTNEIVGVEATTASST